MLEGEGEVLFEEGEIAGIPCVGLYFHVVIGGLFVTEVIPAAMHGEGEDTVVVLEEDRIAVALVEWKVLIGVESV